MPNQASPVLDLRDPGGTSDFHTKTIHDEVELSQSGQAASGVHGAALAGSSSFGPGATWVPYYNGVNFTLASKEATAVSLCLFTDQDLFSGRITEEIPLDPIANRTGKALFCMQHLHLVLSKQPGVAKVAVDFS